MKKWKEAKLSYMEYFKKEYFVKDRLKNLLFPINFNNFYLSKLSNESQIGVKSIEKNTLELMLLYLKMNKLYTKYKETDVSRYEYLLKTELEHFILRYRLAVNKLESLMMELKKCGMECSNTDYFMKSEEYNQLLGIRNNIAHESIRSHVFYNKQIQREAFQFYTNRSLENNIYLHEVFINPYGSEIYDLKRWLTWMIVLLFNFIDDIVSDVVRGIANKYDMNYHKFNEIKRYDSVVGSKLSTLCIIDDEVILLEYGIEELTKYICGFEPSWRPSRNGI